MKIHFLQFAILLFLIAFISCQKEEDSNTNITENPIDEPAYEQYGTPFDNVPETDDIVLYEVNLRALSSSGDIQGVMNKLDHIKDLGVNVVWLMPIYPIGEINSVNSPYSVKNYKEVSPEYGDLSDLRDLTDLAHSKGMAVMLDWVANHTAWDNPWIENKDWYTQDANGNIIHPAGTNWEDVADLNYNNEEMRWAMIDAMKYWVYTANIDGFRCDYADGVPFDFWQQAWQSLDSIQNRDLIYFAEGSRSNHFDAGFDLNFGWDFYGSIKGVFNGQSASNIFTTNNSAYNNLEEGKHWVRFTTNHDESAWDATPISLFNGVDGALAASVVTIFTGGVPLIYGSQEVGTANTIPFFYNSNINWNAHSEMLEAYQNMLQFYSSSKTARSGENTIFENDDVVCFKKELDGDEVLIIVNVRNSNINFPIPSELENTFWSNVMDNSQLTLSGNLLLGAYEFYILKK